MPGASRRGVFLSYRRDDAGPYARSLQLQLSQRLPAALIFMDLDSIEPGLDFAEVIEEAVNSSAVLVALIGPEWATLTDQDGARRLDNPDDYVRFELKTALERGVRVIPVLIDGANPLRQQDLPVELHKLARLNAHKLSYDRYQDDADRLLDLIQRVLAAVGEEPPTGWERELLDRKGDAADTTLRATPASPDQARRQLAASRPGGSRQSPGRQRGIFLSYYREESQWVAARLHDRLATVFGKDRIVTDVDSVAPGQDLIKTIEGRLDSCGALLAVIGRDWVNALDERGRRRLENPHDWVRLEIESALRRPDMLVIPVLTDNAPMPRPDELPGELARLSTCQAAKISADGFSRDINDLIEILREAVERYERR